MTTKKVIYTGGTFDLLHWGHVSFLTNCATLGNVVVSLNTDEFIQEYKGQAPIMSYNERRKVLEALKCVYEVIPNRGGADSKAAVELACPDMIAVGSDWAKKDYYKQMNFTQDWLDERHIWLVYIPYTGGISTTDVKERLRDR